MSYSLGGIVLFFLFGHMVTTFVPLSWHCIVAELALENWIELSPQLQNFLLENILRTECWINTFLSEFWHQFKTFLFCSDIGWCASLLCCLFFAAVIKMCICIFEIAGNIECFMFLTVLIDVLVIFCDRGPLQFRNLNKQRNKYNHCYYHYILPIELEEYE